MDAQQLNDLQHKARQYDDAVQALHVCDGGRYRNDTITSLIAAARERDELLKVLKPFAEVPLHPDDGDRWIPQYRTPNTAHYRKLQALYRRLSGESV